jgi:hypothetical protein
MSRDLAARRPGRVTPIDGLTKVIDRPVAKLTPDYWR